MIMAQKMTKRGIEDKSGFQGHGQRSPIKGQRSPGIKNNSGGYRDVVNQAEVDLTPEPNDTLQML